MLDAFVPLHAFLQPQMEDAFEAPASEPQPRRHDDGGSEPEVDVDALEVALDDVLAQTRRFAAALADAFDAALETLLADVACEVLARELRTAPADVAAIARRARDRCAGECPVAICAHPEEAVLLAPIGVEIVADERLRRGDLCLRLQSGTIDLRLGARLERVLAACLP